MADDLILCHERHPETDGQPGSHECAEIREHETHKCCCGFKWTEEKTDG